MSRHARVLVVDDDDSIRHFIEMALSDDGYEVRGAAGGAAALEIAAHWPPSVILLDIRMPGIDGHGFAARYRETPGPHAPIMVLTAARDAGASARELEADAYLAKPFDLSELLGVLGGLIQKRARL